MSTTPTPEPAPPVASGTPVPATSELLTEALCSLERVGCQFDCCDGPTLEPVNMVTCHVCEIVARLRVALGRPARLDDEMTAEERITERDARYMRRVTRHSTGGTVLITMGADR